MRKKNVKQSPAREVNSSQLAAVSGGFIWPYTTTTTTATTEAAKQLTDKAGEIKDKPEPVA